MPRWSFDQTPIEHRKEVVARLIEDIEREKRAMNDLKSEKGRLEKAGGSAM